MPDSGAWTPRALDPYAWYDAHLGGYATGIRDLSRYGRADAVSGGGSNAPQWLPWTGQAQVYFPGTANNYLVTGNLDHTGDYTARVHLNYRSIGNDLSELVSDRASSVGEATLRLTGGTGLLTQLNHLWWESGVAKQVTSTNHGLIDGQDAWVGVERINNSGGVYRIRFYKSLAKSPPMTDWTGWTLISEHVGAAVAAPSVSTSNTYIGGANTTYTGAIYRVVTTNNGTQTIDFNAELCGQSGYTDSIGNVWTVNRSTTGRKSVVQSPIANSNRGLFLFGTDDWIDVPAAAIPALDVHAASSSVNTVARRWHNPGTSAHAVFATKANSAAGTLGATIRNALSAADPVIVVNLGDGTTNDTVAITGSLGSREAVTASTASASPFISAAVNGGAPVTDTVRATTVTTSTGGAGRIGAYLGGTGAIDMEFEALLTFNRELTAAEVAQIVAYYRGGL